MPGRRCLGAQPLTEVRDFRCAAACCGACKPEAAAVAGHAGVRLHQASGLQLGMEEDRRADGDALAGDRCGNVQMLGSEVGGEALRPGCWRPRERLEP